MFPKYLKPVLARLWYFLQQPLVLKLMFVFVFLMGQAALILAFRQHHSKVYVRQASSVLSAQSPPAQAEPYARKAVELNPRDGYAWFYYGTAVYLQAKMGAAVDILQTAVRVLPHSNNALRLLAFSHYREQRYEEAAQALEAYLTMVPLPPVSPDMVFRMAGLSFLRMGKLAEANMYLTRATDLVDDKGELLRVRATISLLCNQSRTAEYCFRAFRFYDPDKEFNPFELINNAAKANKTSTAVAFFEAAHYRDPDDLSVVKALAAGYIKSGRVEKAKNLLHSTVSSHADNPSLRLAYGDVLFADRKYREAFEQYDKHLELEPESRYRQDILRKKATTRF